MQALYSVFCLIHTSWDTVRYIVELTNSFHCILYCVKICQFIKICMCLSKLQLAKVGTFFRHRIVYHRAKFDHCLSCCVRTCIIRDPKNLGMLGAAPPLGMGAWLMPYKNTSFRLCYRTTFSRSRSNHTSVNMEICQKNLAIMSHISRSFKLSGTDTDWSAACDFLLVIHGNCGPISYCFWDMKR